MDARALGRQRQGLEVAGLTKVSRLAQVSRLCAELDNGEASSAFGVRGFPVFFVLEADQSIVSSSYDPADLPGPARVW